MRELPNSWAPSTIGEITDSRVDQNGPDLDKRTFTYVDISAIDRETKRIENPQSLDVHVAPSRARQRLKKGDVLVSMTRPNLNAVALVPLELDGSVGSTGFHVIRSSTVSQLWIAYRVQAHDFISAMSLKVQGALYPAVRPKDIEGFPVDLPPRKEQERIVAEIEKQFTRLDAATVALKRVQANLKRYRASVLKAACEGRLVPTEAELARKEGRDYEPADKLLQRILRERRARWEADTLAKMQAQGKPSQDDRWKQKYKEPSAPDTTNLPELPEGWCWATVDQIAANEPNSITDGPFGSNLKTEHYTVSGPRVVRLQNIGDGLFRDAEAHISEGHFVRLTKHQVLTGDIVIAALGDTAPRACIVPEIGPAIVKADCIRYKTTGEISSLYILAALNSEGVRKRTTDRIHGIGRPRLNLQEIREIVLPIPPISEQNRIVARIDEIISIVDKQVSTTLAAVQGSARLRQSILIKAFSGQLLPQNPTDEPASMLLERIRAERAESTKQKPVRRSRKEPAHV